MISEFTDLFAKRNDASDDQFGILLGIKRSNDNIYQIDTIYYPNQSTMNDIDSAFVDCIDVARKSNLCILGWIRSNTNANNELLALDLHYHLNFYRYFCGSIFIILNNNDNNEFKTFQMTKHGFNHVQKCRSKRSHNHSKNGLYNEICNVLICNTLQSNIINDNGSAKQLTNGRKPSKLMQLANQQLQKRKALSLVHKDIKITPTSPSTHKSIIYNHNVTVGPSAIQQTAHKLNKLKVKHKYSIKLTKTKHISKSESTINYELRLRQKEMVRFSVFVLTLRMQLCFFVII